MVKQALSCVERNVWNRKWSGKGARAECRSDSSGAGWSAGGRDTGEHGVCRLPDQRFCLSRKLCLELRQEAGTAPNTGHGI